MAWSEKSEEREGSPHPTAECQFSARDETEDEDGDASSLPAFPPALPHSDAKVRSKRLVLAEAVSAAAINAHAERTEEGPLAVGSSFSAPLLYSSVCS